MLALQELKGWAFLPTLKRRTDRQTDKVAVPGMRAETSAMELSGSFSL